MTSVEHMLRLRIMGAEAVRRWPSVHDGHPWTRLGRQVLAGRDDLGRGARGC